VSPRSWRAAAVTNLLPSDGRCARRRCATPCRPSPTATSVPNVRRLSARSCRPERRMGSVRLRRPCHHGPSFQRLLPGGGSVPRHQLARRQRGGHSWFSHAPANLTTVQYGRAVLLTFTPGTTLRIGPVTTKVLFRRYDAPRGPGYAVAAAPTLSYGARPPPSAPVDNRTA